MPEEHATPPQNGNNHAAKANSKSSGWPLIAVQSIACAVVLLITLLFRLAGGDAFSQLQAAFSEAVADNSVMATIAALFDTGEPDAQRDFRGDTASTTSTTTTTSSTATATSTVSTTSSTVTKAANATQPADAEVVAVAQSAVEPPDGYSFLKLQTNQVARLPVDTGVLTSGYGYRENPTGSGRQFHAGVDIAADAGEAIYAMYFGVVMDAGVSDSYGHYIQIYHGNGLEILYAHCSKITAEIGEVVKAGDKVALVGATGDATGNHVHIEVYRNDTVFNPSGVVPVTAYA